MTITVILGIVAALVGSGGIVWGALRYNRQEAGEIVQQHSQILADMRSLNEELHLALSRAREERDQLRTEVEKLNYEVGRLRILYERTGRGRGGDL